MSAADVVLAGRIEAESLMLDTCTVGRPGAPVTDPVTGQVTTPLTPIYSGKCKFQQTLAQSSNPVAGEHQFTVQDVRWDTPVGAGPFLVDDVVTATAVALDPGLAGAVFRVTDPFHKTAATAQRTRVERVVA